jgi:hypothetical protein
MTWCGVRAVVLHQRGSRVFPDRAIPPGDFGDAVVSKKFGEVPDGLSAL